MPIFAKLMVALLGPIYTAIAAVLGTMGTVLAIRVSAVMALATLYLACATAFTAFLSPLFSKIFHTQYGQIVGLAFPPVAGSILAGMLGLWMCVLAKRYTAKLVKMAAP